VSTLDVQQDDDGFFLVMDYIEGPSLQQVIRAKRKAKETVPLDILLAIFLDALAGLHAAHELRDSSGSSLCLVHRDVSPHNILIGVDGIARITDFGVARAEARLSSTHGGQLKGKIGYMAPEQARLEDVDRRTDIYAAGVLLWEALTGERLVNGASEALMLAIVAAADHKAPRDVNPSVPQALNDVCARALRRAREDRYETAAALAEAVEKAAAEDGVAIATSRAVGAFIAALRLHARPVDLPGLPPPSASFPPPVSVRTPLAPAAVPASDASFTPASRAVAVPPPTSDPLPFSTTGARPNENDTGSRAGPRRSSARLLAFVGAITAVAATVVAVLVTRSEDRQGRAGASPAASEQAPSVAPPSVNPSPPPPPVVEPAVQAAANDGGVSDAGETSAPSSSASAAERVEPAPRREPGRPAQGASGGKPGEKGPVYRPPEL
jgi:eukaryotic-like serine/threonine-protein kinase